MARARLISMALSSLDPRLSVTGFPWLFSATASPCSCFTGIRSKCGKRLKSQRFSEKLSISTAFRRSSNPIIHWPVKAIFIDISSYRVR